MTTALADLCGLLVDLDGVVYEGDRPLPGVSTFFPFLREIGLPFLLTTNNSTLRPRQYVEKLARMDVVVSEDEVLGSAGATAQYLLRTAAPGTRVFVIGEDGLRTAILEAGFELSERDVEYVVVGLDRELTYEKLTLAVRHVLGGAAFIGSNPDTTLPMPDGVIPGAGSFHAAIRAATGVAPVVIGKPEPTLLLMGTERLGCAPAEAAILGDRLDTDIVGGSRAGLTTIMVLTGVSKPEDVERSPIKPDYVFEDLPAVQAALAAR
jgi:4-nitrophenyl phosphatase